MFNKLSAIIFISLLLLTGCVSQNGKIATTGNEKVTSVGIKELAADPIAYTGKLAVKGVVQAVDDNKFLFRLIDEEEFKTCGLNPCGAAGIITIYTPDSTRPAGKTPSDYVYDAKMPKVEDRVTVEGEVKKMDNGYAFEVSRVIKGSDVIIKRQVKK